MTTEMKIYTDNLFSLSINEHACEGEGKGEDFSC